MNSKRGVCMGKSYGYARCSTDESKQDINRQKRELKKLGVNEDKYLSLR